MRATIVRDQRFLEHDQGMGHPECPERLMAIDRALEKPPVELVELPARLATIEEVSRVHTPDYVRRIDSVRGRALRLDPDTSTSEGSVDAAFLAAGATIDLFAGVAQKTCPPGIALVRPPGHHALPDRAMGFCIFNNIAVAAQALLDRGLAERIAIYDWDVHHGNGTQDMFYDDPRVLYLSTHQWPFYPGSGASSETGAGKGEGATLNIPLPAGTGDAKILAAIDDVLIPKVHHFKPDIVLISAGFDPYENDPLGGFRVTLDGFKRIAARWREVAERECQGKIAAVLEGGYDIEGLGACVRGLLEAWS